MELAVTLLLALLAAVIVGAVFSKVSREYAGLAAFVTFVLVVLVSLRVILGVI